MANKVISIEIGNAFTRIVQMDYMTKHPKVYRHTVFATPEGAINDGYISADNSALAEAIKNAIEEEKMVGSKNVVFTIASSKILTREVMLPPVKTNAIDSTIKMNLSEYFPIDLSQHEVSNIKLETIKDGDNAGKHRVLIIAAEKELIRSYEILAKACDLTLLQIDYVGNSVYQCFKNEAVSRCNMILKVEESQTTITIVDHQNLLLQRNISYGFEEVIQEVANQTAFGVGSYDKAADYIKKNICILENLSDTASSIQADEDEEGSVRRGGGTAMLEAKASVTRSMSGFINAVSRVVDFYNSRYSVAIDRIYVTGLGGDFTGINTLLTNEMGIKTHILKKLEEIQWLATTDAAGFHVYAAAIGAGIAPVGLYSKAREDKAKRATNYKMLSLLCLILCTCICLAFLIPKLLERMQLDDEHRRLSSLETTYIEAENVYHQYEGVLNFYKGVYTGSLAIESPNDSIVLFFEELENVLPADSSIVTFISDGKTVTMVIRVKDDAIIPTLTDKIRSFSSLQSVNVYNVTENWIDNDALNGVDGQATDNEQETDENAETVNVLNRKLDYVEFTISGQYYLSEFDALTQTAE